MMLALFTIMVVTGLTLVVIASVMAGQSQTRHDESFEQALEVAEVGLGQMNSLIQSNPGIATMSDLSGTTSDGGSYTVSAVKAGLKWSVTARGTARNGKIRTVTNTVAVGPLFNAAAFGKVSVDFRGGNGADSYNSNLNSDICKGGDGVNSTPSADYVDPGTATNALSDQTNVRMCQPTRFGQVGTNGELYMLGTVADHTDSAAIFNAKDHVTDPLPNATGTCMGVPATCDMYNSGRLTYEREPVPFPAINACTFPADSTPTSSSSGGTYRGGRAYNLSDVTLDGTSVFDGTPSNPSILCVSGTLNIAAQSLVNFTTGTHAVSPSTTSALIPRSPASVLIYVTGSSNSGVVLGDHSSIAAAIYAPNAAVSCGPQGNFYGSLVANSITNGGGWNFHYDDALRDQLANAPVRVSNWAEIQ